MQRGLFTTAEVSALDIREALLEVGRGHTSIRQGSAQR
jgi:hypothetical protein